MTVFFLTFGVLGQGGGGYSAHARKHQNNHDNKLGPLHRGPASQNFASPDPFMFMYCRAVTCGDTRVPFCT